LGAFSLSQPNSALGYLPINLSDIFQWELEADNPRAESDRELVEGYRGTPKNHPPHREFIPVLTQVHLLAAMTPALPFPCIWGEGRA